MNRWLFAALLSLTLSGAQAQLLIPAFTACLKEVRFPGIAQVEMRRHTKIA
jgi:hypothetical protein